MASRVVAWFSCGAASAVAAKLAVTQYGHDIVEIVYCDTMQGEHPDNQRFLNDVALWIGKGVVRIASSEFATVEDVFAKRRYMSGPMGAPCTIELKKRPRFEFQRPDDIHIFGFTADEEKRSKQFSLNNPEINLDWIVIRNGYTKEQCLGILKWVGIKLPAMYGLGYKNNNCLGCVKATSPKYWNMVRRDFPEVFERRISQSRDIGTRLVRLKGKRIFLDELPVDAMQENKDNMSCGPECGTL